MTQPLKIGVLGSGPAGRTLASGFLGHGHPVMMIPDAYVVKGLNTVVAEVMINPRLSGGEPDMFIAGDSEEAKQTVASLLGEFG
jgi:hypothetical protein